VGRRGASLPELLVALLILAVGLMGMMSAYGMIFTSIDGSGKLNSAHHIARRGVERVKVAGFWNAPIGALQSGVGVYDYPAGYYSDTGELLPDSTGAFYRLDIQVTDAPVMPVTGGTNEYALSSRTRRNVSSTVVRISDGEVLATMGTLLVRGGL
jgi:prepilin-type N-terminal cleavage/methylation domain-containing protein